MYFNNWIQFPPMILLFALLVLPARAGLLIKPEDALKLIFSDAATIQKSNVALNPSEFEKIRKKTSYPLKDKIFTFYKISKDGKVVGHAGLFTDQIRSKDQTLLFAISPDGRIQATEVIAHYEPPEYTASKAWLNDHFKGKSLNDTLKAGEDIPVITGATLTTESVSRSARVILAIWNLKFEKSTNQP